jgi:two-component system NarL family sensor kinase
LLDGFANRSGIQVDLQVPKENVRFSAPIELALFRVLQESLRNVHRHSGSPRVDVRFDGTREQVTLEVRDYGRGMPDELLRSFEQTDSAVGIGLAGMRERISELNGRLKTMAAPNCPQPCSHEGKTRIDCDIGLGGNHISE